MKICRKGIHQYPDNKRCCPMCMDIRRRKRLGIEFNPKRKKPTHKNPGDTFGRLTIVGLSHRIKGHAHFLCKCSCGNHKIVSNSHLISGNIKSCGCLRKEVRTKPPGEATWTDIYLGYRYGARSRKLEFLLTKDQLKILCSGKCHYCGKDPSLKNTYLMENGQKIPRVIKSNISDETIARAFVLANGIDRVQNNKGYELSNCVPCCFECNYSKMDRSYEEFIIYINRLIEFRVNINLSDFNKESK